MRLDAAALELSAELHRNGVGSLLLKGRSFTDWLYNDHHERVYVDVDLLIAEPSFGVAGRVLRRCGFEQTSWAGSSGRTWVDLAWIRPRDGARVEVHRTLKGIGASAETVWAELSRKSRPLTIGPGVVQALDEVGMSFVAALHVAMHGPVSPPLEDLRRALAVTDGEVWLEVLELARRLEALDAVAIGLGELLEGRIMADRIGLPANSSVALKLRSETAPDAAQFLALVAETPGLRSKVALVVHQTFPAPDHLRRTSPLARNGWPGLLAAYALRVVRQLGEALVSIPRWARATRQIRGESGSKPDHPIA